MVDVSVVALSGSASLARQARESAVDDSRIELCGRCGAEIDPTRPGVIASCLEQIAQAVEEISRIAREINLRNRGR